MPIPLLAVLYLGRSQAPGPFLTARTLAKVESEVFFCLALVLPVMHSSAGLWFTESQEP